MNNKFTDYYKSIGMGDTLVEKVLELLKYFQQIAVEEIKDTLLSEYVADDGQREYIRVFFFSENYVYEVENPFSPSPKMWIAKLESNIGFLGLTPRDFDFINPTASSRLNFQTCWPHGTEFILEMKTSGDNCMHLLNIVNKYLKPNIF